MGPPAAGRTGAGGGLPLPDELHPLAAAQLAGNPTAAAMARAALQQNDAATQQPATPFPDDAAYLEAQLERLRAGLERAIAQQATDEPGAARAAARARSLGASIAERLALTPRPPGLETLRARLALDEIEVDTLLHAIAPTIDPGILKLHNRLAAGGFKTWVDVGAVIAASFTGTAERLRARARFLPGARLLAERLLLVDRSRPEARENLLGCELKLPPRVARLVMGQGRAAPLRVRADRSDRGGASLRAPAGAEPGRALGFTGHAGVARSRRLAGGGVGAQEDRSLPGRDRLRR